MPHPMRFLTILLGLLATTSADSIAQETGFLDRSVAVEGQTHRYQVYVPHDYDVEKEWPVILFLHGAGERGDDGLGQTEVGLGAAIRFNPERWPAIAIFPQVPEDKTWQGAPGEAAMAALDATMEQYSTDVSRVYLTGLSMGGNGSWYLAFNHADRFAALVPICGFVNSGGWAPDFVPGPPAEWYTNLAKRIVGIPTWIFHGGADQVVPPAESVAMEAALKAAGGDVRYTEFEGVGHNSWDQAYAKEELAEWLFAQKN
jgi:predicted peptidase